MASRPSVCAAGHRPVTNADRAESRLSDARERDCPALPPRYNSCMVAHPDVKPFLRAARAALLTLLAAACTMPTTLDAFLSNAESMVKGEAVSVPTAVPFVADLPVIGIAPELHDGAWLNSSAPLSMAGLRGKVVALEMWTFG